MSQLRLQITSDHRGRSRSFSIDGDIAGTLSLTKEYDFHRQVVPNQVQLSSHLNIKCIQLGAYLYRLEYGLGNVSRAQTISRSLPPSAFLTRCVAAFLSSTTNRL